MEMELTASTLDCQTMTLRAARPIPALRSSDDTLVGR